MNLYIASTIIKSIKMSCECSGKLIALMVLVIILFIWVGCLTVDYYCGGKIREGLQAPKGVPVGEPNQVPSFSSATLRKFLIDWGLSNPSGAKSNEELGLVANQV